MNEPPKEDDSAPPLTVSLGDGTRRSVHDYRGEALVLVFLRHLQ